VAIRLQVAEAFTDGDQAHPAPTPPAPAPRQEQAAITPIVLAPYDVVFTVPVDALVLDPANVRKHTRRNLEIIRGSLVRFGQQKPILIDDAYVVRAGNGTVIAARELEWKTLRCTVSDLPPVEATAYSVVDNRSTDTSEFDQPLLVPMLESMTPELRAAVGWNEAETQALVDSVRAQDMSGLDRELGDLAGLKETSLVVVVPSDDADTVGRWLANGEPNTAGGRGVGVLRRCGLR
jgi:hypothetical protein